MEEYVMHDVRNYPKTPMMRFVLLVIDGCYLLVELDCLFA